MEVLADILAAEADAVSAFCLLLGEEQELLKKGAADALPEIVSRKNAAIGRLTPCSDKRNQWLAAAGLPQDRLGMEQWLATHPNDKATPSAWARLQQLAAEAKELNRLNGELIRIQLANNARSLESLQAGSEQQGLYGANGHAAGSTGSRIIDSA